MDSIDDPSLVRFELRGPALVATRAAAAVWTAGWIATEASAVSQAMRYGWSIGAVVFVALWTLVAAAALIAIVWAAAGRPEMVTVSARGLQLRRGLGPFARTHRFDGSAIRALVVFEAGSTIGSDYGAIRAFWDRGAGRIGFDVDGRTYAFGPSLDDDTIERVLQTITTPLPASTVQPADIEPDTPRSRRRRPGWRGHLTGWVIIGALVIPARTFITDLPICTGGAFGGDYEPLDPNQLHAAGRVVLAPLGDFPADAAQTVAEHFKGRYGLNIAVGPSTPLPEEAFDTERGQADSEVLLSTLAQSYPPTGSRTIIIGLTSADMFIPRVNWRYAFSNRRPPQLAVVSQARMDRGCMGIRPATDETQLTRLRKMVGKNIGVLFYGLPLSNHPRSLMYASIGGPQELDTMSEEF